MAASGRAKAAHAVVDSRKQVSLPLDFSFKAVHSFTDLLREKPRERGHQAVLVLEEELSTDSSASLEVTMTTTTALRLNNNMLSEWEGFLTVVGKLLVDPPTCLQWIDLSFNDMKTIDDALLQLPNLKMLYLHGNNIGRLAEVNKLAGLPKLRVLTLHGNPIEVTPGYKHYILSQLSQLLTLDFSRVTKSDRATADTWSHMIAPKQRTPRKKKEE